MRIRRHSRRRNGCQVLRQVIAQPTCKAPQIGLVQGIEVALTVLWPDPSDDTSQHLTKMLLGSDMAQVATHLKAGNIDSFTDHPHRYYPLGGGSSKRLQARMGVRCFAGNQAYRRSLFL